jgi:glycosyltransferase involved in cell wall biosynthesis
MRDHQSTRGAEPSVSVVIPTRARSTLLERCLSSLVQQRRPPDEVIVSEDGADPETSRVISEFRELLPNLSHIRHEPPLGLLENSDKALRLANGDLVAMLHDDDEWDPAFLERATSAMREHPECTFCATDHHLISEHGNVLEELTDQYSAGHGRLGVETGIQSDVLIRELTYNCYSLHSSLFRRCALEAVGFFRKDSGSAADLALFLDLGSLRSPCFYIGERLGRYRVHESQNTSSGDRVWRSESLVSTLRGFAQRHQLSRRELSLLGTHYRAAVIELAIAQAHASKNLDAIGTLRRYADYGWGRPSAHRIAVLGAVLVGLRKRPRSQASKPPTRTRH